MIMPDYLSFNHVIGALQIDNDYWTTSQLSRHLEAPFKYLLQSYSLLKLHYTLFAQNA